MRDKIRALVLSIEDYRDNDLMLKCLSKNEGFVTIISKSAKKISTSSHYYPGNIYEFIIDLKDNKTMYLSLGNKLIKNYYDINNLKLLAFKNVLFELCLKSKELYVPDLYTNLEILLQQISDENMYLLGTLFISFCLRLHGLSPQVDGCVVCQNKKVVGISQSLGGFVCENHLLSNKRLDAEVLKKFPFADFKVICDESNNTVNITNKNTLKFVIAYRFNKGDEFTVIQYTVIP